MEVPRRWAPTLAWTTLAAAIAVLIWRYAFLATAALTYDEATYAELARHPWFSNYYPDTLFLRHPPLAFLIMWAWGSMGGASELWLRFPALVATVAGVFLTWAAARHVGGDRAALVAGLLLTASFHLLVYAIQVTMYPFAFLAAAWGIHAHVTGRERQERWAINVLALTHLFGFVFVFVRLWKARRRPWTEVRWFSPALAWFALSAIAAVAVRNEAGPGLGPTWQVLRAFAILYDLYLAPLGWLPHAVALVLHLLLVNPILVETAWLDSKRSPWTVGGAMILAFLFTGPAFLRYSLLVLPIVVALGLKTMGDRESRRPSAPVAISIALAGLLAATAFVNTGYDRVAGNDVPGLVDWRGATEAAIALGSPAIAGPSPTSFAFYLERDHGFAPTDRADAPDRILTTAGDGSSILVRRAHGDTEFHQAGNEGALLVVPETWTGAHTYLFRNGFDLCHRVVGALLLVRAGDQTGCTILGPPP